MLQVICSVLLGEFEASSLSPLLLQQPSRCSCPSGRGTAGAAAARDAAATTARIRRAIDNERALPLAAAAFFGPRMAPRGPVYALVRAPRSMLARGVRALLVSRSCN